MVEKMKHCKHRKVTPSSKLCASIFPKCDAKHAQCSFKEPWRQEYFCKEYESKE